MSPFSDRVWLVAYLAVAAINLIAAALVADRVGFLTVLVAMPLLFGWYVSHRPPRNRLFWFVALALGFSWLGDWLGDQLLGRDIVVKLGLFLVSHLCYVIAFWPYRGRSVLRHPGAVGLYGIAIIGALVVIVPHTGALAAAVVAYAALLGLMAVLATGLNRIAGIGGVLFLLSDLTIALAVWVVRNPSAAAEVLIMASYLVAQLLLVSGVLRAADPGGRAPRVD